MSRKRASKHSKNGRAVQAEIKARRLSAKTTIWVVASIIVFGSCALLPGMGRITAGVSGWQRSHPGRSRSGKGRSVEPAATPSPAREYIYGAGQLVAIEEQPTPLPSPTPGVPHLTSVNPGSGVPNTIYHNVTIQGSGFGSSTSSVAFTFDPIVGVSATGSVSNDNLINADFTVADDATPNKMYSFYVTINGQRSDNSLYFFVGLSGSVQVLHYAPDLLPISATPTQVEVDGSGLLAVNSVTFSNPTGITVGTITHPANEDTVLVFSVTVSSSAHTGPNTIILNAPGGQASLSVTIIQVGTPHINSLSPNRINWTATPANFTLTGTSFTGKLLPGQQPDLPGCHPRRRQQSRHRDL